jgi:hypothetical protein
MALSAADLADRDEVGGWGRLTRTFVADFE